LLALRVLHHEECVFAERHIERISGVLDRAWSHVDPARAVLDVIDAPIAAAERLIAGAGHEVLPKHRVIGLEARGIDIGDIVGNDVELMGERHLPRQADEKRILHRYSPLDR